jgi:glycosyltransferase A (GT-A) superfamily protein (DUF2064 family)
MIATVVVLAKKPEPGRVKTRLVPPLTPEQAAAVAAAALRDTLDAVSAVPAGGHLLALDGEPGPWLGALGSTWRITGQVAGGLDARIVGAFAASREAAGPTVLVGMDTPQLRPHQLAAFDPARYDACLGRSADGGYWAIGLRHAGDAHRVISGVPMSTGWTAAVQLGRLQRAGLRVQLLDRVDDVDTVETARRVAELIPDSRFARTLRSVDRAVS